jgi:CheY-like chemotaxis protein
MSAPPSRSRLVLVVEDDEELRELVREALELNDYRVVVAQEGQQALDALARIGPPRFVLLDLLMPGMNGWEFLERMRARPELADVPVVVCSSVPSEAPPGVRVMPKPLNFERLLSVAREYCAP